VRLICIKKPAEKRVFFVPVFAQTVTMRDGNVTASASTPSQAWR
jgi:hypothetical protein